MTYKHLAILALLFAGCNTTSGELPPDGAPPKTVRFVTVQHDSHWWIYSIGDSRHFVHHPDCPCSKHRRPLLQDAERQSVD